MSIDRLANLENCKTPVSSLQIGSQFVDVLGNRMRFERWYKDQRDVVVASRVDGTTDLYCASALVQKLGEQNNGAH